MYLHVFIYVFMSFALAVGHCVNVYMWPLLDHSVVSFHCVSLIFLLLLAFC